MHTFPSTVARTCLLESVDWAPTLPLPLGSHVTFSKCMHFSEPQFLGYRAWYNTCLKSLMFWLLSCLKESSFLPFILLYQDIEKVSKHRSWYQDRATLIKFSFRWTMLLTNITSVNSRESSIDESLCPYSVCPSLEIFVAQTVKNLPARQETQIRSLVGEDPLEKGMSTCSSILAWGIPWIEEPGEL